MGQHKTLKYPVRGLEIGETVSFEAPTKADTIRIHKNVHQTAERNGIYVRGKMDRASRTITFTRVR